MLAHAANSLGLVCDIIGVVLIWRYGLPPNVGRGGHRFLVTGMVDEKEKATAERYDWYSKCGLGLIVLGFAMQLASNWL